MQEVTLTLPMMPDMELTASRTAVALGEQIRMSPDKIDEVSMAVVEACINAFEHSEAPDRRVVIQFLVLGTEEEPDGLQITVRDSGIGFDASDLPNRDPDARLPQKRGHGLKIIAGLMDDVDIETNSHGTVVTMRKMC